MQRPKVESLPEEVRSELEQKLIQGGFQGYEELAEWLQDQGFEISKSSLHRFGQKFENRLKALKTATDQAKAVAEASADEAGDMNEALIRLVQTKVFELLVEMEDGTDLTKIGRMVADLARASVSQKKWSQEAKEKIKAKLEALEKEDKGKGLSPEMADKIRREILGVL
jgi:hypothetical protein